MQINQYLPLTVHATSSLRIPVLLLTSPLRLLHLTLIISASFSFSSTTVLIVIKIAPTQAVRFINSKIPHQSARERKIHRSHPTSSRQHSFFPETQKLSKTHKKTTQNVDTIYHHTPSPIRSPTIHQQRHLDAPRHHRHRRRHHGPTSLRPFNCHLPAPLRAETLQRNGQRRRKPTWKLTRER